MIRIENKPFWICPGGAQVRNEEFNVAVKDLITRGSKVYVGTDSMVRGDKCIFATVIAFHNNEKNIATYYYKKFNLINADYRNLKIKITEEVNLSVQAAQQVLEYSPGTNIEVHVDIGINKENKTRSMLTVVSGWVSGMGFDLKVKPESWASSSIADNHTK
tara:strand:- start:854 stop:1336 length:483 start_codon:yes stop_codon:yes gene_type:complete